MRALVTGSRGFVGSHLVDLLRNKNYTIQGFNLRDGQDLRDYEHVRLAIDTFRPDYIFHVGALAYVPESFADPQRAVDTNITGSLNILKAVRQIGLKTRIQFCGSSEEYGDAPGPLTEESLPNPLSPYAIAKLAMDHFGQLYARSYDMDIVVTRAFNHTGPGRGEQYAESSWAKQIVQIERGKRKILLHGDLTPTRNFTDVRDMVRAYEMAINLPSGVYNICSDQNWTMQEVLDELRRQSRVPVETRYSSQLMRPADFSFSKPLAKEFTSLTGWKPKIEFKTTLSDILGYWRDR